MYLNHNKLLLLLLLLLLDNKQKHIVASIDIYEQLLFLITIIIVKDAWANKPMILRPTILIRPYVLVID